MTQKRKSACRRSSFEMLEARRLLTFVPEYVPGELIVGFEGDVPAIFRSQGGEQALQHARSQVGQASLVNPSILMHNQSTPNQGERLATVWKVAPGKDIFQALAETQRIPGVAYAELNYIVSAQSDGQKFPSDARFNELYGLHNTGQTGGRPDADIDAPEAWFHSQGSGQVVVGVIDTGVNYDHPDLSANIWTNLNEIAGNGMDDDFNGFIDDVRGWDFVDDDNDPMDRNGHGTHVSGTIGAVGNTSGVVGVIPKVQIMPIRFLDSRGRGNTDDAIAAVNYANINRQKGVNIVLTNNSWGGGGFSQALYDAIAQSGNQNMLFVAAAGNNGSPNAIYPARYELENIISVAASDHNDNLASFSNYNATHVDLAAPGVGILSTRRNGYSKLDGTSMAAPHVSGAAALVWDTIGTTALYPNVRIALFLTVDKTEVFAGKMVTGGRLNVGAAVHAVLGLPPTTPPVAVAGLAQSGNQGQVLSFNGSSSSDADLSFDTRSPGIHTDYRIVTDVRRISNADGLPGLTDANVANVFATVQLRNASGTIVQTISGNTDSAGIFRSQWIRNLSSGNYRAKVVDMVHASFGWNQLIPVSPLDDDLDNHELPDQLLEGDLKDNQQQNELLTRLLAMM